VQPLDRGGPQALQVMGGDAVSLITTGALTVSPMTLRRVCRLGALVFTLALHMGQDTPASAFPQNSGGFCLGVCFPGFCLFPNHRLRRRVVHCRDVSTMISLMWCFLILRFPLSVCSSHDPCCLSKMKPSVCREGDVIIGGFSSLYSLFQDPEYFWNVSTPSWQRWVTFPVKCFSFPSLSSFHRFIFCDCEEGSLLKLQVVKQMCSEFMFSLLPVSTVHPPLLLFF